MPRKTPYEDTLSQTNRRKTIHRMRPAISTAAPTNSAASMEAAVTINRIKELASGNGRKMLSPTPEGALRCFKADPSPGTSDDVYIWLRNLGFDAGYSTVRAALVSLHQDGLIETCDPPLEAVRPGPRSSYYRITERGIQMLQRIDAVLNLIPMTEVA